MENQKVMLISGGAGFIGSNAAVRFSREGWKVVILDNLSKEKSELNLAWLTKNFDIEFYNIDICNRGDVETLVIKYQFDTIIHLAAQVAVTTSVASPRCDFEINALGTLNILEAVRNNSPQTKILYASTNKVYGNLKYIPVSEKETQYTFNNNTDSIDESNPLDFHSPYGCSKGSADQYVLDYARIYALNTVVFRQSCIYGYHQFGVEDQGWVAWFIIAGITGKPVTIYGNGKQVRDLLFIEDLLDLYQLAINSPDKCMGKVYNVGGGVKNSISLLDLIAILKDKFGIIIEYNFGPWRLGDQLIYISSNQKAINDLGWKPIFSIEKGLSELIKWIRSGKT